MKTFKNETTIEVMLSTMLKGKSPPSWGGKDWAAFHKSFHRVSLTPYELAGQIWLGHSFTPVWETARKEENFVAAHHIAFDFDGVGAALDSLMEKGTLAWTFCSFAYSTPSSTPEHPKSRVVFLLSDPICNPQRYRELYQALAAVFTLEGAETDPQCKDPLRLYFGSPQCEMRGNWSALPLSAQNYYIEKFAPPPPPQKHTPPPPAVYPGYVKHAVQKLLDNIRYAPQGTRHGARLRNGRAIGGYVAAGYLVRAEAELLAIEAARAGSDDPDKAEKEILESIEYGLAEPLFLEIRPVPSLLELTS